MPKVWGVDFDFEPKRVANLILSGNVVEADEDSGWFVKQMQLSEVETELMKIFRGEDNDIQ